MNDYHNQALWCCGRGKVLLWGRDQMRKVSKISLFWHFLCYILKYLEYFGTFFFGPRILRLLLLCFDFDSLRDPHQLAKCTTGRKQQQLPLIFTFKYSCSQPSMRSSLSLSHQQLYHWSSLSLSQQQLYHWSSLSLSPQQLYNWSSLSNTAALSLLCNYHFHFHISNSIIDHNFHFHSSNYPWTSLSTLSLIILSLSQPQLPLIFTFKCTCHANTAAHTPLCHFHFLSFFKF